MTSRKRKEDMRLIATNLGFPRIGPHRELKWGIERYWKGQIERAEMLAQADAVHRDTLDRQARHYLDLIPCNTFSLYDHVLDHAVMFGAIPARYGWQGGPVDLDMMFAMARGSDEAAACAMRKWFNTNYHYLVPEFEGGFELTENLPLKAFQFARQWTDIAAKPVIVGPLTFLLLGNNRSGRALPDLLADLLPLYARVLRELEAAGAEWVQMDEPALVMDRTGEELAMLQEAYGTLAGETGSLRIMLQTYFADIAHIYEQVVALPVDGIGLDFVRGQRNLEALQQHGFPPDKALGIGLVDGRNVWRTDLDAALDLLDEITRHADPAKAQLGPSASLLHLPISLELETHLSPEIMNWLAYADERLDEIVTLTRAANEGCECVEGALAESRQAQESRRISALTTNPSVQQRLKALNEGDFTRSAAYEERRAIQREALGLPPLPTTTIGSFPQTAEVRRMRARYRSGEIDEQEYQDFLNEQFRRVIAIQEEAGLDVLVHGEFERSDMVDYFGEQLEGVAFIEGWVQSYGTRAVRPPLIYGDVWRPGPMTVEVARAAQALTERPVKGMLTGPVTILMWSFPRVDVPPEQIATQLALAIRDEVLDLEAGGIRIIQIDEPAFREGLPLKRDDWADYLRWAVRAFRLASGGVQAKTQVHTHMCYSDFNDIMPAIRDMDADVISIEMSRSGGALLQAFQDFEYGREIGPGVYDVHSERVPSAEEMRALLVRAAQNLDPSLLWVNPDCGLKTRGWEETIPALRNMVEAASQAREQLFKQTSS